MTEEEIKENLKLWLYRYQNAKKNKQVPIQQLSLLKIKDLKEQLEKQENKKVK